MMLKLVGVATGAETVASSRVEVEVTVVVSVFVVLPFSIVVVLVTVGALVMYLHF